MADLSPTLPGSDQSPTAILREFFRHQKRRGLSPKTIRQRRHILGAFASWLDPRSVVGATQDEIERWLDELPLANGSRYLYISSLAAFFRYCVKVGAISADPTADIDRPRLPRRTSRPIGDDELDLAIRCCAEAETRAWLTLAAFAGLRCVEIANLRRQDVLDRQEPPLLFINGKGGHQRYVPLHAEALDALRLHGLPVSGPVFSRNGRPMKPETISSYIGRHMRSVGIAATAHQLRHWFGTNCYRISRDLLAVQRLLGHSSPGTTAGYVGAYDATPIVSGLSVGASSTTPGLSVVPDEPPTAADGQR